MFGLLVLVSRLEEAHETIVHVIQTVYLKQSIKPSLDNSKAAKLITWTDKQQR